MKITKQFYLYKQYLHFCNKYYAGLADFDYYWQVDLGAYCK